MTLQHKGLFAVTGLAVIGLAVVAFQYWGHERPELEFQGWVEAELIFVSAEEAGRLESLSVREGDGVDVGSPLFALDADLQRAAVAENEAAVVNARQSYERAQALLKRAVGSQKSFDDAEASLRSAEARLNSTRTRLERRKVASPVKGSVQEVYFRTGEMVHGRGDCADAPARAVEQRDLRGVRRLPRDGVTCLHTALSKPAGNACDARVGRPGQHCVE